MVGVARVIAGTVPSFLRADASDERWNAFGQYLETGIRLNINIRQVLPAGVEQLPEEAPPLQSQAKTSKQMCMMANSE